MLIGAHIIVAAGLGSITRYPLAAFVIGVTSHFIGDKIPHWEYSTQPFEKLKNKKGKEKLLACFQPDVFRVLCAIALEIAGGFTLAGIALTTGHADPTIIQNAFWGGLGGLIPDVLWGIADNSQFRLLKLYSRFHHASHTKYKHGRAIWTLGWQILVVGLSCALLLRV